LRNTGGGFHCVLVLVLGKRKHLAAEAVKWSLFSYPDTSLLGSGVVIKLSDVTSLM
jgi:hypothetical protein